MNADINETLEDSMTVEELRDALRDMPDGARVVFACDYGDICHTQQALLIRSAAQLYPDTDRILASAYSNSGIAIEEDFRRGEDDEPDEESDEVGCDDEDEQIEVVVLRAEHR
jgi:hypothetical protein